ncbi:MAG: hypothetical protein ACO3FQ_05965, partial [Terrimicrobiaceae bacterium]
MTNIQTLPNKSQPAESGRAAMGNFFQAPAAPVAGNLSNPDFDSFLSNPDSKNQAEELREEQEAAKKRKKPVDSAMVQGNVAERDSSLSVGETSINQTKENKTFEQDILKDSNKNDLDFKEGTSKESLDKPENGVSKHASCSATQKSGFWDKPENSSPSTEDNLFNESTESFTTSLKGQFSSEEHLVDSKNDQSDIKKFTENEADTRGTETAFLDDEMIAMATLDGVETPTQPLR